MAFAWDTIVRISSLVNLDLIDRLIGSQTFIEGRAVHATLAILTNKSIIIKGADFTADLFTDFHLFDYCFVITKFFF